MKKTLLLSIICVIAALMGGCYEKDLVLSDTGYTEPSTGITRSIYIYMCGGDAETNNGSASEAIKEMTEIEYPDNVKVIVQTGGSLSWQESVISPDRLDRFEILNGGVRKVESVEDDNMGTSTTLIDFLKWGNEAYPAEDRMLIIWGQGGTSVGGIAYDARHNYDSLTPGEIAYALSKSNENYSMIGLDGCMMSTLETAAAISPYASYMTASEEIQPCSWDYRMWLEYAAMNPTASPLDIGKKICDSYYNKCVDMNQEDYVSVCVSDLSNTTTLLQAFDGLAGKLNTCIDNFDSYADFSHSMNNVHIMGGKTFEEGYSNLVDLADFSKQVSPSAQYDPMLIETALADAVAHKVTGLLTSYAGGIGIFYPVRQNIDELKKYFDITASSNYVNFLRNICSKVQFDDEYADYSNTTAWNSYLNEKAYFNYNAKIAENKYEVNIVGNMDIACDVSLGLYKYDENSDDFLFISDDNIPETDRKAGIYKDSGEFFALTLNGIPVSAQIADKGDNYTLYSIPAYVNNTPGNIRAALITSGRKPRFKVYGFWEGANAAYGISDRKVYKIFPFDKIEPYFISYGSGEYFKSGKTYAKLMKLENQPISDGQYKLEYRIRDIYGDVIRTDPSVMTVSGNSITKN